MQKIIDDFGESASASLKKVADFNSSKASSAIVNEAASSQASSSAGTTKKVVKKKANATTVQDLSDSASAGLRKLVKSAEDFRSPRAAAANEALQSAWLGVSDDLKKVVKKKKKIVVRRKKKVMSTAENTEELGQIGDGAVKKKKKKKILVSKKSLPNVSSPDLQKSSVAHIDFADSPVSTTTVSKAVRRHSPRDSSSTAKNAADASAGAVTLSAKNPIDRSTVPHSLPASAFSNTVREQRDFQPITNDPYPLEFTYNRTNKLLGQGAFGNVTIVTEKSTLTQFACKEIAKTHLGSETSKFLLRCEIDAMKACQGHPYIVRLIDVCEDKTAVYLILEMCPGGDLFDRIMEERNYSEFHAANITFKLLSVLTTLHQKGIVHRDLKPENIMYNHEHQFKLTDFGVVGFLNSNLLSHRDDRAIAQALILKNNGRPVLEGLCGSTAYIAPEVINATYDTKCDIWSVGVITYVLLSGRQPFVGRNDRHTLRVILTEEVSFEDRGWESISKHALDFIRQALNKDQNTRPDAVTLLKHPWLAEGGANTQALPDDVKSGIQKLSRMNNLKQQALVHIATTMNVNELVALRKKFDEIDTDKSGEISLQELKAAIQKQGKNVSDEVLENFIASFDVDGSKNIDFEEFLALCMNMSKAYTEENLAKAFKKFDLDGDGSITVEELEKVLVQGGCDREKVEEIVKHADLDGNGEIDFEEFCEMMAEEADESDREIMEILI